MKYLPTENITYKSKLNEEEILKRLSEIIEPEKMFRFDFFKSGSSKSYEGQIIGHTFDISRIISDRNSFLPRISGVIERDYNGLTIKVKMRLHLFVLVFLCICTVGVGIGCFAAFLTQVINKSELNPVLLAPFGFLAFMYLLTMFGFKTESRRSKKDLQLLFEADIIED